MKPLICTQCGGKVDPFTYRCSFCGTYFERPDGYRGFVVKESGPAKTICAEIDIPMCMMQGADSPERLGEFIQRDLVEKLAEGLLPEVTVVREEDVHLNTLRYRGYVRVLPASYRF